MTGADPALIADHLALLAHPDGRGGWFALAAGASPHYNSDGRYGHKHWNPHPHPVADIVAAVEWAASAATSCDIYVCPAISVSKTSRDTLGACLLWSDLDNVNGAEPKLQALTELGALSWTSGSPGHLHLYVPLAEPLAYDELKAWQRRLAMWVGADPSPSAPNGMLRLAGTLNHKHPVPTVVGAGWDGTVTRRVSVAALGRVVAVRRSQPRPQPVEDGPTVAPPPQLHGLAETLADADDRSEAFYRLVANSFETGVSLADTVELVRQYRPAVDKYGERLAGEVERVWRKLEEDGAASSARQHALEGCARKLGTPPDATDLTHVEEVFRKWLVMEDPVPLRATLGAVAAFQLGGDPFGLLVVGGSGSAKTVLIESLRGVPSVAFRSHLTGVAALLSGVSKKEVAADATGGVLREIGAAGVLALKDFTTVLAMNHDGRAEVLAALREVLDGSWSRSVGTDGGKTLHWAGRCLLLGACTTALDAAHSVLSTFGNRFMIVRTGSEDRHDLARRAFRNQGRETEMRRELAAAVSGLLSGGCARKLGTSPEEEEAEDRVVRMAVLTSLARSPIERDHQGEISLVSDPDAPTRAAKVLGQLREGLLAIGVGHDDTWRVLARVALDSVPKLRRLVLVQLLTATGARSTPDVAAAVEHPTRSVRRALEDLEAHHLIRRRPQGRGHADLWEAAPETQSDAAALGRPDFSGTPPS